MKHEIQPLPVDKWKGYRLPFTYTSTHYYDAEISQSDGAFNAVFLKKRFAKPFAKMDSGGDLLYADWWEGARAFGIFADNALICCLEIWHEAWSNRSRVTELWVDEDYRRQGFGKQMLEFAKQEAQKLGCRAMMLETQSCNENAIAFYLAQGLTFFGFDRCCYGNQDIEKREIRIELGMFL